MQRAQTLLRSYRIRLTRKSARRLAGERRFRAQNPPRASAVKTPAIESGRGARAAIGQIAEPTSAWRLQRSGQGQAHRADNRAVSARVEKMARSSSPAKAWCRSLSRILRVPQNRAAACEDVLTWLRRVAQRAQRRQPRSTRSGAEWKPARRRHLGVARNSTRLEQAVTRAGLARQSATPGR